MQVMNVSVYNVAITNFSVSRINCIADGSMAHMIKSDIASPQGLGIKA